MIASLLILQIVLPLALIAWLAFAPLKSRLGLTLQVLAVALALLTLWRAAVWTVPPWWTITVYAVLAVIAAAAVMLRVWSAAPLVPLRFTGWIGVAIALVLGAYFASEFVRTVVAAGPPAGRVAGLAFPLPPGDYLVVNGGGNLGTNAHADALDQAIDAHRAWWGTSYGVDLVAIDRWGLRASGVQPSALEAYRVFGVPVTAPCAGRVVVAVDGFSDMTPPQYDLANLSGNHVILACGDFHVVLAHFKNGSVDVRQDQMVVTGQLVGRVGNSGGSDEPHLHIHVQLPGTAAGPMSGRPIPATYKGRFLVRGNRIRQQ